MCASQRLILKWQTCPHNWVSCSIVLTDYTCWDPSGSLSTHQSRQVTSNICFTDGSRHYDSWWCQPMDSRPSSASSSSDVRVIFVTWIGKSTRDVRLRQRSNNHRSYPYTRRRRSGTRDQPGTFTGQKCWSHCGSVGHMGLPIYVRHAGGLQSWEIQTQACPQTMKPVFEFWLLPICFRRCP